MTVNEQEHAIYFIYCSVKGKNIIFQNKLQCWRCGLLYGTADVSICMQTYVVM